jgi:pimeloyl-ACP methyl ester carboxylesterase
MLPILLVPGLNCSARLFAAQVPLLWQSGPVMVANHARGASMAEIAAAILADAPPQFALAGFSMGGYIVFEMLRQARDRVKKLALIDTSARPDTEEQSENRRRTIALTEAGKFQAVLDQQFPNVVDPAHVGDAALREKYMTMAHECGSDLFIRHQRAVIARIDSRPDLTAITIPTTVLVGAADKVTPPEVAREMAAAIAGAHLVEIPAAGHISPLEQPDSVNAALRDWAAA